jgi:hypothetical protein
MTKKSMPNDILFFWLSDDTSVYSYLSEIDVYAGYCGGKGILSKEGC